MDQNLEQKGRSGQAYGIFQMKEYQPDESIRTGTT